MFAQATSLGFWTTYLSETPRSKYTEVRKYVGKELSEAFISF